MKTKLLLSAWLGAGPIIVAQMSSLDFKVRLFLLCATAIFAGFVSWLKAWIPKVLKIVLILPIIEEVATKDGLLDFIFLNMLRLSPTSAFLLATAAFVLAHFFWTISMGIGDLLLRVVDSVYIGIICGAFYLSGYPHSPDAFVWAMVICVLIHGGINLVIVLLKLIPFMNVILAVCRVLLCLLYLYQAWRFLGNWRAVMIPFFLQRFLP